MWLSLLDGVERQYFGLLAKFWWYSNLAVLHTNFLDNMYLATTTKKHKELQETIDRLLKQQGTAGGLSEL